MADNKDFNPAHHDGKCKNCGIPYKNKERHEFYSAVGGRNYGNWRIKPLIALMLIPLAYSKLTVDYVHLGVGTQETPFMGVFNMELIVAALIIGGILLIWMATQVKEGGRSG